MVRVLIYLIGLGFTVYANPPPVPQTLFAELKRQSYSYRASLTQEHYLVGDRASLVLHVQKGGYNVAGKPVRVVSTHPLQLTQQVQTAAGLAEQPSAGAATSHEFRTDLAGQVEVTFPVTEAGAATLHVFFLHPTAGYNEHYVAVAYSVFAPQVLLAYFLVPWLLLGCVGCAVVLKRFGRNMGKRLRLRARFLRWLGPSCLRFMPAQVSLLPVMPMPLGVKRKAFMQSAGQPAAPYTARHPLSLLFPSLGQGSSMPLSALKQLLFWVLTVGCVLSVLWLWQRAAGQSFMLQRVFFAFMGCVGVLVFYSSYGRFRSSLMVLLLACLLQLYVFKLGGESLRTLALQSVMDTPVLKTSFAVLLFVNLWFPMPLSALSFYVTDWLSGVSPLSSLWLWLAAVAWLSGAAQLFMRRPGKQLRSAAAPPP